LTTNSTTNQLDDDLHIPAWMAVWLAWISDNRSEIAAIGYPDRSLCMVGGWARGENYWSDLEDHLDAQVALTVDAIITSLPPEYRAAVEWVCGLQRVSRPSNLERAYTMAIAEIELAARRKGVVL